MSVSNRTAHSILFGKSTGFTLLEVLLVLTIIGMVSVLVIPNVSNLESRTFSAQVRQAVSLLNFARRTAVVQGSPASVEFYARPIAESKMIESAISVGYWEFSFGSMRFIDSTDIESEIYDKKEIIFYPEGGSTGGTFFLSFEGNKSKIEINSFTGRVKNFNDY
ncbi:MAG: prepilin-type N-terminal cleavage/methylation domain-containing protein [Gammaproteobacteria bacterium]|nr:prepilin-type N-terminal cleavage/methylation domain-containing protein [Gammaproteobacteria bacterium]